MAEKTSILKFQIFWFPHDPPPSHQYVYVNIISWIVNIDQNGRDVFCVGRVHCSCCQPLSLRDCFQYFDGSLMLIYKINNVYIFIILLSKLTKNSGISVVKNSSSFQVLYILHILGIKGENCTVKISD